mgnify:CR=1 FL=1
MADSIQFRQINIAAATPDEARAKADSIQKALAGGADFDALAKRYGQTGEKVWFTGQQYEMAPSMNQDNRTFVNALLNGEVNQSLMQCQDTADKPCYLQEDQDKESQNHSC